MTRKGLSDKAERFRHRDLRLPPPSSPGIQGSFMLFVCLPGKLLLPAFNSWQAPLQASKPSSNNPPPDKLSFNNFTQIL